MFLTKEERRKLIGNVREVLNLYRFLQNISGEEDYPKINKDYFLETKGTTSTEKRAILAQSKKENIINAINSISDKNHRRVIIDRFCAKNRVIDSVLWNMSRDMFYKMFDTASVEFEEIYKNGELLFKLKGDDMLEEI